MESCYGYGGFSWCTQTNPAWAYNHFPGGCSDPKKDYWYLAACNQASVSSILCSLAGAQWCSLEYTMANIPEYAWSICTGMLFSENLKVFNRFSGSFSYQTISAPYTWDKIDQNLQYGPVIVGGVFNGIKHTSLIIGKNPTTGKRIYNDPYFNPENPNPAHRVYSHYLENYLNITIEAAASIRP
jgi:hypothetical protein